MKLSDLHQRVLGTWTGTKKLWLEPPPAEPAISSCRLTMAPAARGKFLTAAYTWAFEGKPQEGLLLLGNENKAEAVSAAWVDSFHMSGKVMQFDGTLGDDAVTSLHGFYEAPPGPDWGWRITLQPTPAGTLRLEMYNLEPHLPADAVGDLAVIVELEREA